MAAPVPRARDVLLADLEIPVTSLADVYGGKLVAAMDRQYPRDLYDVMQLFDHEGITPAMRRAFVKAMKTKWGSCNASARRVWFNLELAKKPVQCIEYIVVHELAHLL
ncbi:MAG: nucleotidyl transferase AbiEii/AbiGii toxin family protein [Caldimonas sp.]